MKSFQVQIFNGYLRRTARATITFHAVFTICLRAFYELVRCETVEAAGTACPNQVLLAAALRRMSGIPGSRIRPASLPVMVPDLRAAVRTRARPVGAGMVGSVLDGSSIEL